MEKNIVTINFGIRNQKQKKILEKSILYHNSVS